MSKVRLVVIGIQCAAAEESSRTGCSAEDSRRAAVEESSRTCCNVGSRSAAAKVSSRTGCNVESEYRLVTDR